MKIKDMFEKPIDRDIQGVIKVGQDDGENIKQELEEYVITRELEEHFREFFKAYKKGINSYTDKMGVWISGFFGSGKSHFLKILSYLLENKEVSGKNAIDYFIEDNKIKDIQTLENMKLASEIPTDVVLFNIDSKSKSSGTKGKDSILNVFLKVFNEMQGYSTDPHLADLERLLDEEGLYEKFQESYKKIHNLNWIENRRKFKFHKSKVADTLVDIDYMSKESAIEWTKTTTQPYEISIEKFANIVKEYLDKKGENHHIVFLADEIGQYIGDNTDLMLNLQTITEDLGTACGGKAWIVVTSQQDIDSITKVIGEDFSKIQGRFDTRLSLTSANVDEVIKLRILQKNETAKETLSVLFQSNETRIKNLIIFNDGIEKKLYENKQNFYEIYPFIPYQFNLLASVLTSIRQHGASGKHLSEGERSMLALFKESAENISKEEDGTIVPFYSFYNGLEKFLDSSHSIVIKKALDNEKINPDKSNNNFNVNVLKTLFLIKYVKEIEANLENITSLMVSNIDDDRIKLKDDVERALRILEGQTLVQKNGDIYIFLTNEEQEINRQIERESIETGQITKKIAEIIYQEELDGDKIKYNKNGNNYIFSFNRFIDGESYGTHRGYEIGIDVITAYSEKSNSEINLRMSSEKDNKIYIDLPQKKDFVEEIKKEMKIEKYLNTSNTSNIPKYEELKALKKIEMREHQERGRDNLKEALKSADFYLNGEKIKLKSSDFKNNVEETLRNLIDTVYHKLNYIESPMDEKDIRDLFKNRINRTIQLGLNIDYNKNAIKDVLDFIKMKTRNHSTIAIKEIKDRFKRMPYGFLEIDTEWVIAKLFVDGNISFTLNGESISFINNSEEEILKYITKKQFSEKLLIQEKEVIEERYLTSVKTISKDLFKKTMLSEDTDIMIKEFREDSNNLIEKLNNILLNYNENKYPGESIVKQGIELLKSINIYSDTKEIFKKINNLEDEYLDFEEDYEPIESFFNGEQKNIWDKTMLYIKLYEESKSYILNEEIENLTKEMQEITLMKNPYSKIKDLPNLNKKFMNLYLEILDKEMAPVKKEIERSEERVLDELAKTDLEDKFRAKFTQSFNNLLNKAKSCDNVAEVNGIKIEAETLKMRYLREIEEEVNRQIDLREKENIEKNIEDKTKEINKKNIRKNIRRRNINIKEVNINSSWQIKTQEDLDKYILELKNNIEKEIEENTILNIEF